MPATHSTARERLVVVEGGDGSIDAKEMMVAVPMLGEDLKEVRCPRATTKLFFFKKKTDLLMVLMIGPDKRTLRAS